MTTHAHTRHVANYYATSGAQVTDTAQLARWHMLIRSIRMPARAVEVAGEASAPRAGTSRADGARGARMIAG